MKAWWRRERSWVALVAACFLILQSLTGALAMGGRADPAALDAFGNVICTAHGADAAPAGGDSGGPRHLPDCCLFGCSLFGAVVLPAPAAAGLILAREAGPAPLLPQSAVPHRPGRRGAPASPRAPPTLA
ncbi:DUF2946 family protein [Prosthecomicrobium pneumaticum]|uniref:DUF2946 domain-containing protein n=1 Tax=Prosthecomicrobium pneumaticum TaxID=81895 RepID=A0A7W9CT40_9HYPH|nr:DUF2946 family protein [Prosthecomicrobium pneumaticum]MBB5751342.1 hypothetical protein [Prosthecomicrobium pneumaticum]